MNGAFEHLHEELVMALVDDKFALYRHHKSDVAWPSHRGWVRYMMHNLTQQVVWQNLV